MPSITLLEKLADLAVRVGVNVQKDQKVLINAALDVAPLARLVSEKAYQAGASLVTIVWSDEDASKIGYQYAKTEVLEVVPQWMVERYKYFLEEGFCLVSISSPKPGLMSGIDPQKMQRVGKATQTATSFFQTHVMGNKTQWTIVAAPNAIWARKVFPTLPEEEAIEKLWKAIFDATRVHMDTDPVEEWKEHMKKLANHNKQLNDYNFQKLHFKNKKGTDLTVELVKNHIWAGGGEHTTKGVYFAPNMPTEETFTMPYKWGTQGKVYATKPLNYQGKLIEDFWLEFKDGKVVNFDARVEKETLKNLLDLDAGSSYIGEIALISHRSPISDTGILFFNTLFDENASCHMALGRAYPMNIKGGLDASMEELEKQGYNYSFAHSDFMFGSEDMEIIGITHDKKEIPVFKKGNFVF